MRHNTYTKFCSAFCEHFQYSVSFDFLVSKVFLGLGNPAPKNQVRGWNYECVRWLIHMNLNAARDTYMCASKHIDTRHIHTCHDDTYNWMWMSHMNVFWVIDACLDSSNRFARLSCLQYGWQKKPKVPKFPKYPWGKNKMKFRSFQVSENPTGTKHDQLSYLWYHKLKLTSQLYSDTVTVQTRHLSYNIHGVCPCLTTYRPVCPFELSDRSLVCYKRSVLQFKRILVQIQICFTSHFRIFIPRTWLGTRNSSSSGIERCVFELEGCVIESSIHTDYQNHVLVWIWGDYS